MYLSVVTIHTSSESTGSHPHPSCVKLCERISLSNNSFDSALLCTDTPAIKIRHAPIHAALKDTAQLMHLEWWLAVCHKIRWTSGNLKNTSGFISN